MSVYGSCGVAQSNETDTREGTHLSFEETFDSDRDNNERSQFLRSPRLKSPVLTNLGSNKMTIIDVLYAYDLTLAQLVYQRFGRLPWMRKAWEALSWTGDGILYVQWTIHVLSRG